ncbi:MAG: hypothetical protein O7I93_16870 [Gemmatimonadetes bacterium]|nr:hypothetical protein [Gemmatimonadota bacterium]
MSRSLKIGQSALCAAVLVFLFGPVFSPNRLLSHGTTTNTVQFDREIVGILDRHCVSCHAEAGPAFPLETYEETWLRRQEILGAVLTRRMPPWGATSGHSAFANDNGLTLRERQFLVSWVEGLGPRNAGTVFWNVSSSQGASPEPVRARPEFDRWQLGEPTLSIRLVAAPNAAQDTAPDVDLAARAAEPSPPLSIRRFVVDPELTEEAWVNGLEYRPTDRSVVRAAVFTIEETGQWLGSWTPWHGFVKLPEDVAHRLPAGSRIEAEIHYREAPEPAGKRGLLEEWGTLGLFLSDQPAVYATKDLVLDATGDVPAGAISERFRIEARMSAETHILSLRPELTPGVLSLEVSARRPNGATDVLLFARDLPLDWPTPYVFENPIRLPAGTRLLVTAYHANLGSGPHPGGIRLTVSQY